MEIVLMSAELRSPSLADNIPAELRARKQWVCHRNKVPFQPNGDSASSTDPATWSTFEAVTAAAVRFTGIGCVITPDDPYVGIDLDDCRDPATGVIAEWAQSIIDKLASYAEVSPSQTGVKIWCKGEIPGTGSGKKSKYETGAVEMYQKERYFTVTGQAINDVREIRDASAEVTELWQTVFGSATTAASSKPLGPDPESRGSLGDMADFTLKLLAMPKSIEGENGSDRTHHVACEIRRHGFYGSEGRKLLDLYNEHRCEPEWTPEELDHKWEAACAKVPPAGSEFDEFPITESATGALSDMSDKGPFSLGLIRWSEFQKDETPLRYLIPGLVAEAEHFVIGGRTKGLKTNTALDMMISLASGQPFLGHFPVTAACPVAFISGESGRKSLQRRAATMAGVRKATIPDDNFFIGFDLPKLSILSHLDAIQKAIEEFGIKLLCVDPAYLATLTSGNADKASNQFAMGLILEPFGKIGVATGCTMALVHHARKASRAEQFQPMTREDLSQSGFDAWMRQWLLLSRRSPFRNGVHELHMEAGGSAGHFGQWAVTVDEGDDTRGRQWTVTVIEADEARANAVQAAQDAKAERLDVDISVVRSIFERGGNKPLSRNAIRVQTSFNPPRLARVIQAMLDSGVLEDAQFSVSGQKPRDGGYRLSTRLGLVG
jgi:hypothetical protein